MGAGPSSQTDQLLRAQTSEAHWPMEGGMSRWPRQQLTQCCLRSERAQGAPGSQAFPIPSARAILCCLFATWGSLGKVVCKKNSAARKQTKQTKRTTGLADFPEPASHSGGSPGWPGQAGLREEGSGRDSTGCPEKGLGAVGRWGPNPTCALSLRKELGSDAILLWASVFSSKQCDH